MKSKAKSLVILVVMLSLGLVPAACGAQAVPTATPVPAAAVATPTPVPPTDTPIPPSNTPAPPTATPVPPIDTPIPPLWGTVQPRVPPTAPPIQPTPGEIVATQVEDVVGIWLVPAARDASASQQTEHHLELTKEGVYRFTAGGKRRDSGQFRFEDTQFVIVWSACMWGDEITRPCPSTYYVYVTKEGDKPVQLRFVMINERDWWSRKFFNRQKLPLVEP